MKKIFLLLTLILLLTSCFWQEEKVITKVDEKQDFKSFKNPINDLEKQINIREGKLNIENKSELLDLAKSYLQYWNAYYKEEVFADKALEILNTMNSEFIVEYLKWYAYEIQTKYNNALDQYNKALAFENITKEEKVDALNQKWHVYDLQWDLEKANKFYLEAEKIDPDFIKTLLNRWRYEARVSNNDNAEKYFNKILEKTDNEFLKSELYYNLSIIYQQKKDWLDRAIEYAKLWIESNKDYSNNYLSLWVSYISKDWDFLDKAPEQLEKSIKLYQNNSMAYKNLWIYYYIKDDFDKAIKNFEKQVEVSSKDILLMSNIKEKTKIAWEYDLARTYALKWDTENSLKYLNEVLNWKNLWFYYSFLADFSNPRGPFRKIKDSNEYKIQTKNILLKYNQK